MWRHEERGKAFKWFLVSKTECLISVMQHFLIIFIHLLLLGMWCFLICSCFSHLIPIRVIAVIWSLPASLLCPHPYSQGKGQGVEQGVSIHQPNILLGAKPGRWAVPELCLCSAGACVKLPKGPWEWAVSGPVLLCSLGQTFEYKDMSLCVCSGDIWLFCWVFFGLYKPISIQSCERKKGKGRKTKLKFLKVQETVCSQTHFLSRALRRFAKVSLINRSFSLTNTWFRIENEINYIDSRRIFVLISVLHYRRCHVVWSFLHSLFVYKLFYKLQMPSSLEWMSSTSIRRIGREQKSWRSSMIFCFPWQQPHCLDRRQLKLKCCVLLALCSMLLPKSNCPGHLCGVQMVTLWGIHPINL